jgi:hypothetical protein
MQMLVSMGDRWRVTCNKDMSDDATDMAEATWDNFNILEDIYGSVRTTNARLYLQLNGKGRHSPRVFGLVLHYTTTMP